MTIGQSSYLDLLASLKPIQLVEQLQHRALHLTIATTAAAVHPSATNTIDLIHEDNARCMPAAGSQTFKIEAAER